MNDEQFLDRFKADIANADPHFNPAADGVEFYCTFCQTKYGPAVVRFWNNWTTPKKRPICRSCVNRHETLSGDTTPPEMVEQIHTTRLYQEVIALLDYARKHDKVVNSILESVRALEKHVAQLEFSLTQMNRREQFGAKPTAASFKEEAQLAKYPQLNAVDESGPGPGIMQKMHRERSKLEPIKDIAGGLIDKFPGENK